MCHCTDCQKSTGSPVASIIVVSENEFSVSGPTSSYECEAKVTRSFVKFVVLKFSVELRVHQELSQLKLAFWITSNY